VAERESLFIMIAKWKSFKSLALLYRSCYAKKSATMMRCGGDETHRRCHSTSGASSASWGGGLLSTPPFFLKESKQLAKSGGPHKIVPKFLTHRERRGIESP